MTTKNKVSIRNTLLKNYKEWHNIADNKGIPFSLFVKQTLTHIVNDYPESMKVEANINEEKKYEYVVSHLSEKTLRDIKNICNNIGCDISTFIKIEMQKISSQYPEKFRKPLIDY